MKGIKTAAVFLIFAGVLVWGYAGFADVSQFTGDPGSEQDPLVTKSFVEKYMQDFMKDFKPAATGEWQVVQLAAGKVLVAEAGTEIILRSGKAVVVDTTTNGVPDLTTGTNVAAGRQVAKNHLIIIPRSDGRGLKAVESSWIMYKGSVEIN